MRLKEFRAAAHMAPRQLQLGIVSRLHLQIHRGELQGALLVRPQRPNGLAHRIQHLPHQDIGAAPMLPKLR